MAIQRETFLCQFTRATDRAVGRTFDWFSKFNRVFVYAYDRA
jgi:hypothetical protein